MIWLEMRTNNAVYDSGWNFTESVWAPTRRQNNSRWRYWTLVNNVVRGDIIFHIKKDESETYFHGYSTAKTDGYITYALPTSSPHNWDYSDSFFKVDLHNYNSFDTPILVSDFLAKNEITLRNIYRSRIGTNSEYLFYTIQNNALQCQFGGYFTQFNDELSQLLMEDLMSEIRNLPLPVQTAAANAYRKARYRIGQQQFSDNTRENFFNQCCFPSCEISGRAFLVASHIARWADNEQLQGYTGNGLCFCLIHDKAFETGYFTIDNNYRIVLFEDKFPNEKWLNIYLKDGEKQEIKHRQINPLSEALQEHWRRIGYIP